jgi:hypothetical protein
MGLVETVAPLEGSSVFPIEQLLLSSLFLQKHLSKYFLRLDG